MFYYRMFDEKGAPIGVMTCSMHLESSETQVEITEAEYNELSEEMNQQNIESEV